MHWKPLFVPPHDPVRYCANPQLMLLQTEHAVFKVPEHPPLLYLPEAHVAHVLHWNPFVVPLQDPLRYFPLAQF